MTIFSVVDIETTGVDPSDDAVVEIACIDVPSELKFTQFWPPRESLVFPGRGIPAEASAVHHIIDEDVRRSPRANQILPEVLLPDRQDVVYVAHNAAFERSFLHHYMPAGAQWLCTYRAALRVWPDAPAHSNQVLRYFLKLATDRTIADQAHRAGPDAYVTAALLCKLLRHASLKDMIQWTNEPPLLPKCPVGEWRGKPWPEVEEGFLEWMLKPGKDFDEDILWNVRRELMRRKNEPKVAYVEICKYAISQAQTVEQIRTLLNEQRQKFEFVEIKHGDEFFNAIVAACTARRLELEQPERLAA